MGTINTRPKPARGKPALPAVLLLILLLGFHAAAAELPFGPTTQPQDPGALVYAAEFGGALGGAVVWCGGVATFGSIICMAGALATLFGNRSESGAMLVGDIVFASAVLTTPAAAGWATAQVGDALGENGSTGAAIGGAYVAFPVAVGLCVLGRFASVTQTSAEWAIPIFVVAGAAVPAGAVVGYNLGGTSGRPSPLGARLVPPALASCLRPGPDGQAYSALDCRIVTVRF